MPKQYPMNREKDTKEKIFIVSARLFAEKGYNGVSMREISEQTGLSKPTIYYHFGNKEGIYSSLIHTSLSHGSSFINNILILDIPVKDKLVEIVKTWFRHVLRYPEFAKFILSLFTETEKLQNAYSRTLGWSLNHKFITLLSTGIIFALSVIILIFGLGGEFLPQSDMGFVQIAIDRSDKL